MSRDRFPAPPAAALPRVLHAPATLPGPLPVVLDTDTYNEIDDQFALVYALLSPDRIALEAVHAAPFHNGRSTGPGDGMEKSYDEIHRVLDRMNWTDPLPVLRGSTTFLPGPDEPVRSEAVDDLIQRAMQDREGPLYVVAIGAITNVASAILIEPKIVERIVVVWLGGQPLSWPTAREFNLAQDVHASRVIFDSGVPLVFVPCKNVAEHVRLSLPELRELVGGSGAIGEYLYEIVAGYTSEPRGWSKVIWDVTPIAALIDEKWVPSVVTHSPVLTDQVTWSRDPSRHLIRVATTANRDAIFRDFADKLAQHTRTGAAQTAT